MFLEEARLASSVSDAHIAQVHELGREGDSDFIVMEYVEGQPLNRLLSGRPLAPEKVALLGLQVARALSRAHRKGLLHRDLKPGNILVTLDGDVKVVDFGLATLFTRSDSMEEMEAPTLLGADRPGRRTIDGTPFYMSPEQVRGERLDARSDVFSLGIVLYQMTTGRLPFPGGSLGDLLERILKARPVPPHDLAPKVPFELNRIIQKALAPRPADRYQTMEDLAVDLKRLGRDLESGSSPSYEALQGIQPPARGGRRAGWMVAGMLVAAAVVASAWITRPWWGTTASARTLLILPMEVRGQADGAEYAGRAFAEAISVNLAATGSLDVLPVPQTGELDGAGALSQARAALGVGAGRMLTGSLTREGSTVRAAVSLVDTARNRILWGTRREDHDGSLPMLAASLARDVASALGAPSPRLYDYFKYATGSPAMAASLHMSEALGAIRRYEYKRAPEATRQLIELFPDEPEAHVLRSYALLMDAGEFNPSSPERIAAEGSLTRLDRLDPENPWDDVFRGVLLDRDGHHREAVTALSQVLSREDLTPAARAYILSRRSGAEVAVSETGPALADLQEALQLDPANDAVFSSFSSVLRRLGRPEEAQARARQALALNPTSPPANFRLGDVLYELGRWEESAAHLGRACEADQTQGSCAYHAVALLMADRSLAAKAAAEKAASLPESDVGTHNLACYGALTGDRRGALRLLRRSLELGPAEPDAIAGDSALASLRDEPEFKAILEDAEKLARNASPP